MSETLSLLTTVLSDFFNENIVCDNKILDTIKHSSILVFEKIMQTIMNQKAINKKEASYILSKTGILTGETEVVIEINDDIGNQFHTTLDSDGENIYLHTYSYQDIFNLIEYSKKSKLKYVFITLTYSSRFYKSSHVAPLVIDIIKEKVYLFEPNGSASYFNDIMSKSNKPIIDFDIDTNIYVKLLFDNYFNNFNQIFSTKYEFIECSKWNPKGLVINRKFKESIIGDGHCAIITLLLPHLLSILDYDLKDIYNIVAILSDTELIYLLNGYTSGITEYIGKIFNIKNNQFNKEKKKIDNNIQNDNLIYI